MKYFIIILFLCFSPLAPSAFSDEVASKLALAQASYGNGNFSRTRTIARQLKIADGYALACQAGLVIGGFQEAGTAAVMSLHGALADCRTALKMNPAHYSAGLSHAIALGFEGQRLRKTSYARASKREIEALIQRYPNNALAVGALGGWHAAVSREGMFARLILSASRAKAKGHYSKALKLPEVEIPLLFEFIRFLASGNQQERSEALVALATIFEKPSNGALEKLLIDKSTAIQNALEQKDKKALKQALKAATPFNGINVWGSIKQTGIRSFSLKQNRVQQ